MHKDDTVIFSCTSLLYQLQCAQRKMGTDFPVIPLNRELHADPTAMRQLILEKLAALPASVTTVLVSMGFCGGSWKEIACDKTIVLAKVDDCITLLLHTDEQQHTNLKEQWHMYMRDSDDEAHSIIGIQRHLHERLGEEKGEKTFRSWFKVCEHIDVIDTGNYPCHANPFRKLAERNAALINAQLNYVPGSGIILEKLVSGRWDEQFIVLPPHTVVASTEFQPQPQKPE